MKKRFPSFLAGAVTALALTALTASALAASGQVQFNFAGVALDGELKITAGSDITAPNGEQVPGSILYVDEAGGKTNYLPVRAISELLGVEGGYDSATRTVLLGEQTVPAAPAASADGAYWHKEITEDGVQYGSEDTGVSHDAAPAYALTDLPEGWGLQSIRGHGGTDYRNGSGGRISFACAYPDGGGYGWSPGSGGIERRAVTVNGHEAELYTHASEYGDSCLLAWEDEDGLLFWFTGSDVDPDALVAAASSVAVVEDAVPDAAAGWLPSGYAWFETNTAPGAAETTWMGEDGDSSITLTCSAGPLLLPEGDGEALKLGGTAARFWEAERPHQPSDGKLTVGGEEVEGSSVDMGGVTVTVGTISGAGAADVATLAWTDADTGWNFRLHGTVDRDTLVRVAESVPQG